MIYAIMILGTMATFGFLVGTFFGGRNPSATPPAPGAGVWANVRHVLDVFGDGIRDASTYALILLASLVVGVEIHGVLGLPIHAAFLAVGIIALGVFVFTANANEAQKRRQGVRTGRIVTKVGVIALAVLILFWGFNGWVPTHLASLATISKAPATADKPWTTAEKFRLYGLGLIALGIALALLWRKKPEEKTTPNASAAPAAPVAGAHRP